MAKNKKDNFNQAMFEMFGVGKDTEKNAAAATKEPATSSKVVEKVEKNLKAEKNIVSAPTATTYLAPGTCLEGKLTSKGDVEIAGEFKGDIVAEGNVTIHCDMGGNVTAGDLKLIDCALTGDVVVTGKVKVDETSSITGNIKAGEVVCSGAINGDMNVTGNVTLDEKAKINGQISTTTMSVACGAQIHGGVEMRG